MILSSTFWHLIAYDIFYMPLRNYALTLSNLATGHIATKHPLIQIKLHILSACAVVHALVCCGRWADKQCTVHSPGGLLQQADTFPLKSASSAASNGSHLALSQHLLSLLLLYADCRRVSCRPLTLVVVSSAVGGKLGRAETQDEEIRREFRIIDDAMQRATAAMFDSRA